LPASVLPLGTGPGTVASGAALAAAVASVANFASALGNYLTTATAQATLQPLLNFTPYSASNPSGYQTYSQVDTRIQGIIAAAPAALDTLGKIAAQLANDSNAAAAIVTAVSAKLDRTANLADISNPAAARTSLGLSAVAASGSFNDLTNKPADSGLTAAMFNALVARVAALEAGTPSSQPGTTAPKTFAASDLAILLANAPTTAPTGSGLLWNNGNLAAFTAGTPSGTTTLTSSALATVLAALPTTVPTGNGLPWLNGQLLAITAGTPSGTTTWTATDLAVVFAGLPTTLPSTASQPWNNGRLLALS